MAGAWHLSGARHRALGSSHGPASTGWFVMNTQYGRWFHKPEQGESIPLAGADEYEAETYFPMLGMAIRDAAHT